jgi:hypothetical protein
LGRAFGAIAAIVKIGKIGKIGAISKTGIANSIDLLHKHFKPVN